MKVVNNISGLGEEFHKYKRSGCIIIFYQIVMEGSTVRNSRERTKKEGRKEEKSLKMQQHLELF